MVNQYSDNRQIIDWALNELATGLQPYVAKRTGITIDADASALIGTMLRWWDDAFHLVLGYTGKNLAYEIRNTRNAWAHNSTHFDDDEVDRALDSMERLLGAIDAADKALRLRHVKEDRRKARYGDSDIPKLVAEARSGSSRGQDPDQSEWDGFARYLRDVRSMKESVIRSRVSNCKRVARFEGGLGEHFENDECRKLLDRLRYTARDQESGRKPNHGVPIDGDVRTGSATLKQAVSLYVKFRQHRID